MAFSSAWKDCVMHHGVFLTGEEQYAIAGLGDVLGHYALEEQLASLDAVIDMLKRCKEETKDKLRGVWRLYLGTSLSLSAMLVVLLL